MLLFLLACADPPTEKDSGRCEIRIRYEDHDGDGFGDVEAPVAGCDPPGADDAGDCDDRDAATYPGAPEQCFDEVDRNCDGSVDFDDADGDGWAACQDCDDADASLHPGADELCDDVDQDCDGQVDEDPVLTTVWYADADGDGWGIEEITAAGCDRPEGYARYPGDCDDADANVNPDAVEVCDADAVDEDCDGDTDEDDATGARSFYADADGDAYGDPLDRVRGCYAAPGYVDNRDDCDDADPVVNPDASEHCDGVDEDCDGNLDDDPVDGDTWYADLDGDGFGDAAATKVACIEPRGSYVLDGTDCDDGNLYTYPGAPEECDGVDDDCDGAVDDAPVDADTWYADADGDGYGDPASTTTACDAPSGYVARGTDCDDTDAAVSPAGTEHCDGRDEDCDGAADDGGLDGTTYYTDHDGDGYGNPDAPLVDCALPTGAAALGTDCDDRDATVSPASAETCDGEDDDCDGAIDETGTDAPLWYADADGDGYGDATSVVAACGDEAPAGYVADDTDCDDGRPDVHPEAAEADCADPTDYNCDGSVGAEDADGDGAIACEDCDDADAARHPGVADACDGVDDDCDGTADEDTVGVFWYADADGDGYGVDADVLEICTPPSGYAASGGDCDDADPAVSPGATESCATAGDDDCDGLTDERDAEGCTAWYLDDDGDGYGSTSNRCYCEPTDAYDVDNADDCDDGDATVSPALAEAWGNGVDDDCDGDVDTLDAGVDAYELRGERSSDYAGTEVAGVGDVDGDGVDDLVVGAFGADGGARDGGGAYLVLGPVSASMSLANADATLWATDASDEAGRFLAAAGDVDGDGRGDFLVTAAWNDDAASSAGAVYLVSDPALGESSLADATAEITGAAASDYLGYGAARAGDTDGDGYDDVLVGAPYADAADADQGAAYLFLGPVTGTVSASAADATFVGPARSDVVGTRLSGDADFDGDGFVDVAISAEGDDDGGSMAGAAYVVLGPLSGTIPLTTADVKITGIVGSDVFGVDLALVDDLDGDGLDDLVAGGRGSSLDGRVDIVHGPGAASLSAADADASIVADADAQEFGWSIDRLDDVDGDGGPDLLVGTFGMSDGGAAWVFSGAAAGTLGVDDALVTLDAAGPTDSFGVSVSAVGDVTGDGVEDLLVGANGRNSSAGSAFLVPGP